MKRTQSREEGAAGRHSPEVDRPNFSKKSEELRIVLVGKTGAGKSASGNTILGRREFESHLLSTAVKKECEKARAVVDGRYVLIVDTPGLFDTFYTNGEITKEITKCLSLSSPGPHVILLIVQVGRFTREEQDAVKMIQEIFGKESTKHTIVLFTHGDRLKKITIEELINERKEIQEFIAQCRGGYHVFNNEDSENHTQVTELLQKIDRMVTQNGGGYYTTEMYQRAQAAIERGAKAGGIAGVCFGALGGAAAGFVMGGPVGALVGAGRGAMGAGVRATVDAIKQDKCTTQ